MKTIVRHVLLTLAAFLVIAAPAGAQARFATVADALGDSRGAPDLEQARVAYDPGGRLTLVARYAAPVDIDSFKGLIHWEVDANPVTVVGPNCSGLGST